MIDKGILGAVRELINEKKLADAIELLVGLIMENRNPSPKNKKLLDTLTIQKSKLNVNQSKKNNGVSTNSNIEIERRQIAESLLSIARELEKNDIPTSNKKSIAPIEDSIEWKTFTIKLDTDFDKYSDNDQLKLVKGIATILSIENAQVIIKTVEKGSVILTLEIPKGKYDLLLKKFNEGALDEFGAVEIDGEKKKILSLGQNSKLVKILKLLTRKELEGFGDFVNSPYFNKNEKCIALYKLLLPYAPGFTSSKLNNPKFLEHICANVNSMDLLGNEFVKLIEKYMIEEHLKRQEGLSKYFLLEELKKRGEQKHFNLIYERSLNKIKKEKESIGHYYGKYLLESSHLNMLYNKETSEQIRAAQLMKTIKTFEKYVILDYLKLSNMNYLSFFNETMNFIGDTIPSSGKIIKIGDRDSYKDEILIQLHLLLLQLYKNKKEEDCINLFNTLKLNYHLISMEDYSLFYKGIHSFYLAKVNEGNTHYYRELFEIYQFEIKAGIFLNEKNLDPKKMKNIVVVCMKVNQIDLAEKLLDKFMEIINPLYREVTINYCKGYIYFYKKEYEIATNYLMKCLDLRGLFELDAQTILYKIYYETNESWAFDIPLQSFITRLSQRKNSYFRGHMEGYLNFFRILKQIYRKRENQNSNRSIEGIKRKLSSMKYNSDKKWLLEKLNELEKKET